MAQQDGKFLKKKFGQHFLRDSRFIDIMIKRVGLSDITSFTSELNVFEIGGGAGALTRAILAQPVKRLWVFEIDPDWAVELKKIDDTRLNVFEQDFLRCDFSIFEPHKPWILLANLPYQITFAILYLLQRHRALLRDGVIMIQEEVAQKVVKTSGRGFGVHSLFLQYYFDWQLLDKVPPEAFYPAPKIFSRLLYFKPKSSVPIIPEEEKFWHFVRACFSQPRRTLRNNLLSSLYDITYFDDVTLGLRAQQLTMPDFVGLWARVIQKRKV